MMEKKYLFILPVVLFITIFLYNDLLTVNIMEARNFITAREIIQDGSWLLPTMNGELRIAKPPLPSWITTVPMMLAGTDADLSANRIPAGFCALFLALFTFLLARRVSGNVWIATTTLLVLATSYMFLWSARKNEWDIYAITAMTGALWALLEAFMRKEDKSRYFLVFSLLLAFSFLSKGPVAFGVMLVPFLAGYCLAYGTRDFRENWWGIVWGVALFAVLAAAWPAYVYLHTPHEATAIASRESIAWFTNHTRPFWYYPAHLQEIVGVWVFFLLYGLVAPFTDKDRKPWERFSAFWFILTIVFLSVFPEKKLRYLLPAVVPGSIVSAMAIYRLREAGGRAWKVVYGPFSIVTGLLFLVGAGALAYFSSGRIVPLLGVLPIAFCGGFLIHAFMRGRTGNAHLTAITGMCLCLVFLAPVIAEHTPQDEILMFMRLRQNPEFKGKDFYSIGNIPHGIVWAAGRKIRPISEDQLKGLEGKGTGFVVITTGKIDRQADGLRIADSIKTEKETYSVYLMPGG